MTKSRSIEIPQSIRKLILGTTKWSREQNGRQTLNFKKGNYVINIIWYGTSIVNILVWNMLKRNTILAHEE